MVDGATNLLTAADMHPQKGPPLSPLYLAILLIVIVGIVVYRHGHGSTPNDLILWRQRRLRIRPIPVEHRVPVRDIGTGGVGLQVAMERRYEFDALSSVVSLFVMSRSSRKLLSQRV